MTAFETAVKWGNQQTGDKIASVITARLPERVTSPLAARGPSKQEKTAAILMVRMRHAEAAAAAEAEREVEQAAAESKHRAAIALMT